MANYSVLRNRGTQTKNTTSKKPVHFKQVFTSVKFWIQLMKKQKIYWSPYYFVSRNCAHICSLSNYIYISAIDSETPTRSVVAEYANTVCWYLAVWLRTKVALLCKIRLYALDYYKTRIHSRRMCTVPFSARLGGGGCLLRVCLPKGCLCLGGLYTSPLVYRITDKCKNITFPQLCETYRRILISIRMLS